MSLISAGFTRYVGLHALQALPLMGSLATRWRRVSTRGTLGVAGIAEVLYGGLVAATLVSALPGAHPVSTPIAPWLSPSIAAGFLFTVAIGVFTVFTPKQSCD